MSEWLSAREVGEHLGLHVNTVKRIPSADLPYYRLCARGDRRYQKPDVVAFIERRKVNGGAALADPDLRAPVAPRRRDPLPGVAPAPDPAARAMGSMGRR